LFGLDGLVGERRWSILRALGGLDGSLGGLEGGFRWPGRGRLGALNRPRE